MKSTTILPVASKGSDASSGGVKVNFAVTAAIMTVGASVFGISAYLYTKKKRTTAICIVVGAAVGFMVDAKIQSTKG